MNLADCPPAAIEEVTALTQDLPNSPYRRWTFQSGSMIMLQFSLSRVKQLKLRIQVLDDYPRSLIVIDTQSHTLEDDALERVSRECHAHAQAVRLALDNDDSGDDPSAPAADSNTADSDSSKKSSGKGRGGLIAAPGQQVTAVVRACVELVERNLLLPCFGEVQSIMEMFPDAKVRPSKGHVKLKLEEGQYRVAVAVSVPNEYPDEPVAFTLSKSNFPPEMTASYQAQGDNLVKKLAAGYNILAEKRKPAAGADADGSAPSARAPVITNASLQDTKSDVVYLKKVADLREQSDDKQMRRKLVRMTKKENARRLEEEAQAEAEAREIKLAKFKRTGAEPLPSLLTLVQFIMERLALLPSTECQVCDKPVLPTNPKSLRKMAPDSKKYPLRSSCGHWFHRKCLGEFITSPPFLKPCRHCERTVSHPDWSSDVKLLEKAWAQEQARKREMSEITDFLGI